MKTYTETFASEKRSKLPMSDSEILSSYNHAKDKPKQIKILADLNVTTKDAIRAILIDNGCILDKPKAKPESVPVAPSASSPARLPWTAEDDALLLEMKQTGHSNLEISEKLGRTAATISWRFSALKKGRPLVPAPCMENQKTPVVNPEPEAPLPKPPVDTVSSLPAKLIPTNPSAVIRTGGRIPEHIAARVRYALTLCTDTANAFTKNDDVRGCIALGELKQLLSTLKYDVEKELLK